MDDAVQTTQSQIATDNEVVFEDNIEKACIEEEFSKEWICKRCGQETASKSSLIRHLSRVNPCEADENTISCKDYIKELKHKEYNEKTYDCENCGTRFNSRSNKSRHKKTCVQRKKILDSNEVKQLHKTIEEYKELVVSKDEMLKHKDTLIEQLKEVNKQLRQQASSSSPSQSQNNQYKKKKISTSTRANCWRRYVQTTTGHGQTLCFCCKMNTIDPYDWECGHIVAESQGGSNEIDNLRPICRHCNNDMGAENMREFASRMYNNIIP